MIEFRAFDKFNEKMTFSEEFSRHSDVANVVALFEDVDESRRSGNRVEVMRSSTRRDKNGKKIFAGDIVLRPTGSCTPRNIVDPETGEELIAYKPNPPIRCIVYDEGHAFYLGSATDARYFGVLDHGSYSNAHGLEVIGNIHEPVPGEATE